MPKPPSEWTVLSMLKWATSYFEEKEVRSARYSIEWLLAHVLNIKRLDLYLLYDRPLTDDELGILRPLVKRRSLHEPLQYITGTTDFLNTVIKVAPGVLIPRMETEQLVDIVLNEHSGSEALTVLDIGTGSGCIPITLKKNRQKWIVHATDISELALSIAKENSLMNSVDVNFHIDDLFDSTAFEKDQRFDLILSNPPYILKEERDNLHKEVKEYEPEDALFCESTSSMYGAIEKFASKQLQKNGYLYLELHEHHAQEVLSIFKVELWKSSIHKDYDGKDRFLLAKKIK